MSATDLPALFAHPPATARGAPFWSWNGALERPVLLEQIDQLARMGMGGVHIHARTGLADEYLGPAFMDHVKASVRHCRERGLLAYLYDEDRWPSGAAGGLVTRDPAHRLRYLLFTPRSYAEAPGTPVPPSARLERWRTGDGRLLGRYALRFADGRLAACRRLADADVAGPGESTWYAYLEVCPPSAWYNHQGPLDVLSPAAVQRFIEVTHETYRAAVGGEFGRTVPAIFTDEPLFTGKSLPSSADDRRDQWMPWTDDLADTLRAAHGLDILARLPALFFDGLPDTARVRWCWHDHVAERFRQAFAEPIGAWCDRHGLLMTGHLESEGDLAGQVARNGECMRFYQPMQLPGIDMLCDTMEFTTALQTRSVARQEGRAGVMSELYGVTDWDFDFTGHKRQGDWQAALGITLRVHHLAWVTMGGEAKRDYPAAIDAHSPWWREYPLVEDHYARLNVALASGQPRCRVAVVHPVESMWLAWGQLDTNQAERAALEQRFRDLTAWLLHGLVDFDFVAESLLPRQQARVENGQLVVGHMRYDALLVPGLRTIRTTTLDLVEALARAGGRAAFVGRLPEHLDGAPSARPTALDARCDRVAYERQALLDYLEPLRDLRAVNAERQAVDGLVHQLRSEGPDRWLFVCNTDRTLGRGTVSLELRGAWTAEAWDTFSGQVTPLPTVRRGAWTAVPWTCHAAGHTLIRWRPVATASAGPAPAAGSADDRDRMETGAWEGGARAGREIARLPDPAGFDLDEPNVLLLDRAEGRLDDGAWEAPAEVLQLDNRWRERLGWGRVTSRIAQPWAEPPEPFAHHVVLRYRLRAEAPLAGAKLALEHADLASVTLNGQPLTARPDGWWVDRCLATLALPDLPAGEHRLEIRWPYGRHLTLERCYVLGRFGVRLAGAEGVITAFPASLHWGDLAPQGLPFYAGNVTYRVRLAHAGGPRAIQAHRFRAPLLRLAVDGRDAGAIAFPPYTCSLGDLPAGEHELALTCFGNRRNAFGAIHHAQPERHRWWGPDSFRTAGTDWSEEYVLKPHGVLSAPIVLAM